MIDHPLEEPAPTLGVAPDPPGHSQPPEDWHMPPGFAATVTHPDTGAPAEYKHLIKSSQKEHWEIATMCKEQGRLFQGYRCPKGEHGTQGTDTSCKFIRKQDLPPGKKPTYVRTVVDYREQKADPYRVRNTVGGNLIDFPGDVSTKGADLVTSKILMNDIISDPKGKATCIDTSRTSTWATHSPTKSTSDSTRASSQTHFGSSSTS
jgi:hypothetical protein